MSRTGLSFHSQLGRDQQRIFGSFYPEVNDSRFEYIKPCKVLSSYHEHKIPDFGRIRSRDNKAMYCNMTISEYSTSIPLYLKTYGTSCNLQYMIGIDFSKPGTRFENKHNKISIPD